MGWHQPGIPALWEAAAGGSQDQAQCEQPSDLDHVPEILKINKRAESIAQGEGPEFHYILSTENRDEFKSHPYLKILHPSKHCAPCLLFPCVHPVSFLQEKSKQSVLCGALASFTAQLLGGSAVHQRGSSSSGKEVSS